MVKSCPAATRFRFLTALCVVAGPALLASCGDGGSSGSAAGVSSSSSGGSSVSTTTWVADKFAASSSFAEQCAKPRSGVDTLSGKNYTDVQGTALDEKNWLRSWTNELYLWYDEVVDQDPASFTSDSSYFDVLKTKGLSASGALKDRFHFTYATTTWEQLSESGIEAGYGATFTITAATPPRSAVVAYTEPGSPATNAPANLVRGTQLLSIDGVDLVTADDQASIDTLNAGLSPQTIGESHTFTVQDPGATSARTITLVSASVTTTPVQDVQTIATSTGKVGYFLFTDHIATAESELISAFNTLKAAAVTDLVLDIRYNGGGYLDIASEVAYMIAGPAATTGQTFELTQFNSKHTTTNPITGQSIQPVDFHATSQGFSTTAGQALPTLNLSRVYLITGAGTCSASESIINSLQGVNVQVVLVGATTCGKPYGFYPADNCAVTYFSIQFRGVNAKNFGDYSDGFRPANSTSTAGVAVPGCAVADDFTHALGDASERRLASALSYRASGVCPVPPASVAPQSARATNGDGTVIKSLWRSNRIYR